MNPRHVISCFIICLLAGCSGHPSVWKTTEDLVIIKGSPEYILESYDLAKAECLKYERPVRYIPDYSTELKVVAFECIAPDPETVAAAEAAAAESEAAAAEAAEMAAEEETNIEDSSADTSIEETTLPEETLPTETEPEETPVE